ncbi:MAG: gamma-glutamylcyclotransferase family protein [Pseudomonadota bacterium]
MTTVIKSRTRQQLQYCIAFIAALMLSSCSTVPTTTHLEPAAPPQATSPCNIEPTPNEPHFIIGYGSLMQTQSRRRTVPNATTVYPIALRGYQRGWYIKGVPFGFSTTFLGITPKPKAQLNGVLYQVNHNELLDTDKRESGYCRHKVATSDIDVLAGDPSLTESSHIWVYASHPGKTTVPSPRFPIVQSYVDIFVSGCMELETQYQLTGFAKRCITSTHDWSTHWVNDRLHPRRPFIFQPKSIKIDKLLKGTVPQQFDSITIE